MRSDTSEPPPTVARRVDQQTGVPEATYYWDGQLAPKIEIAGRLVEQLSGCSMIAKDLDNSLKWFRQAENMSNEHRSPSDGGYIHMTAREQFDTVKALFVAAVTFYGKCFTESSGRRAQLSRADLDLKYRETHDHFMAYRHNLAAHSGEGGFESAKTFVLITPDRKGFVPLLPTARFQHDLALSDKGDIGFGELIEHARAKAGQRYDKLARKIINELILPAGVEFWCSAADSGRPVVLAGPSRSKS